MEPNGTRFHLKCYEPCSIKDSLGGEHSIIVSWEQTAQPFHAYTPKRDDFTHDVNGILGHGVEIVGAYAGVSAAFASQIARDVSDLNNGRRGTYLSPTSAREDLEAAILEKK